MSFPPRTGYLDPTGRATSPSPAAPVTPAPTGFIPVGPQTYAPMTPHRRHPLWAAVFALLLGLVLAVPVVLLAGQRNGEHMVPHVPTAVEAKAACKTAIEAEAQGRLENAQRDADDSAVPSVTGVDIDEPVRIPAGYRVDGTIHFAVLSILGQLPATVFVTCTATIKGSSLVADVQNR